jgi:hypothetical protein
MMTISALDGSDGVAVLTRAAPHARQPGTPSAGRLPNTTSDADKLAGHVVGVGKMIGHVATGVFSLHYPGLRD